MAITRHSLGEWKTTLLNPCINSIIGTMTTLFMSPLGDDRVSEERNWYPQNGSSYPLYENPPLLSSPIDEHSHRTHIFILFIQRGLYLCQTSMSPTFQSYSFQVPDHPVKPFATAYELIYNYTSGHFSFQTK